MDKLEKLAKANRDLFFHWLNNEFTEALMYDINVKIIQSGQILLNRSCRTPEQEKERNNEIEYRKGQQSILNGVLMIKEGFEQKHEVEEEDYSEAG